MTYKLIYSKSGKVKSIASRIHCGQTNFKFNISYTSDDYVTADRTGHSGLEYNGPISSSDRL